MHDLADQIHAASLAILADPGVRLHDPDTVALLGAEGCAVTGDRVRIHSDLVNRALAAAPATFTLKGRSAHRDIDIGGDSRCMAPAYGAPTVTTAARKNRPARWDDYLRIARLVQASDLLHLNGGILVQPPELDPQVASLAMTYAALILSDKPLLGIQGEAETVRRIMALGEIASGGSTPFRQAPCFLFLVSVLSPLQMDAQALATLRVCAECHQPVIVTPGLMFGSTGPITPMGSLVQANAEFLAGLCIAQTLKPGLPVVYGCLGSPADLRTGGLSLASPSRYTFKQMATAMAETYDLPNRGIGAVTDAARVSVQSGYEAMQALSSDFAQRTSVVLHAAGILQRFASFSFEQFMVDLEILRMLNTAAAPPQVGAADLALDVIRDVGPGGEFLTHPHTLKHCRNLLFAPRLSPPRDGDPAAIDALIQKELADLEDQYTPPPLDAAIQTHLENFMRSCGVSAALIDSVRRAAQRD